MSDDQWGFIACLVSFNDDSGLGFRVLVVLVFGCMCDG